MTITTWFCPICGAANDLASVQCFACKQLRSGGNDGHNAQDGSLLQGRYRLGTPLGTGGFSAVYCAWDMHEGRRPVAIKRINLQGLTAEEAIEATTTFNREVEMLTSLSHSQVPRIYAHFSDQDHWYLVLEYIEGQTLEAYLQTCEAQNKKLKYDEVISFALQLCTVLDYLHNHQPPIIFRDLKPSNIMCTPKGNLCLIDFGIARHFIPGQTRDTQPLGSPGYAAPEQYGRAQTTPQADIYSLGALLYQMLSGQDPSDKLMSFSPLYLSDQFGKTDLEMLVEQMLSPNPLDRPLNVRLVANQLEQIRYYLNAQDTKRIWSPPVPQEYTSSGGQLLQMQLRTQQKRATSKRRSLSRRGVLIGLGTLGVIAVGGEVIRSMNTFASLPPSASASSTYPLIYKGHTDDVSGIAWSPDSKLISSVSLDRTMQIWSASDGDTLVNQPWGSFLDGVSWSPNGQLIVVSTDDGRGIVCNATDGSTSFVYQIPSKNWDSMGPVAWNSTSQRIASGNYDGNIQVWGVSAGAVIHPVTYTGHTGYIIDVSWSPDGKYVASASYDKTVRIWNIAEGSTVFIYQEHTEAVNGVAWSPDGQYIASASEDGSVRVWNANNGKTQLTYLKHADAVEGVTWSPDGQYIASCSQDETVQVWYASSGQLVFTYPGHTDIVYEVKWSPDGQFIASGSADATVQVWNAP